MTFRDPNLVTSVCALKAFQLGHSEMNLHIG